MAGNPAAGTSLPCPALHGSAVLLQPPPSIPSCCFPQQLLWTRGSVSQLCSLFSSFSCLPGTLSPRPASLRCIPPARLASPSLSLSLFQALCFSDQLLWLLLSSQLGLLSTPATVPVEDEALLRTWLGCGDMAQLWAQDSRSLARRGGLVPCPAGCARCPSTPCCYPALGGCLRLGRSGHPPSGCRIPR